MSAIPGALRWPRILPPPPGGHSAEALGTRVFAVLSAAQQDAVIRSVVQRIRRSDHIDKEDGGPELEANAAAGLIARAFGLDGPQMVLDAAWASSLVAAGGRPPPVNAGTIDMARWAGTS